MTPEIATHSRLWGQYTQDERERIWVGLSEEQRGELQAALPPVRSPPRRGPRVPGVVVMLGVGMVALFLLFLAIPERRNPVPYGVAHPNAGQTKAPRPKPVGVGDTAVLRQRDGKIFVARTEDDYQRGVQLAVAGDTLGMAQMALAGRAFLVEQGTAVRIIGHGVGRREVRILDGQFLGESGWIAEERVRRK